MARSTFIFVLLLNVIIIYINYEKKILYNKCRHTVLHLSTELLFRIIITQNNKIYLIFLHCYCNKGIKLDVIKKNMSTLI